MKNVTITRLTWTATGHPNKPECTAWTVEMPGIQTQEFYKEDKAIRYADALRAGHTMWEARSIAHGTAPVDTTPATEPQKELVARLLATTDTQDIDSLTIPSLDMMTKRQAAWLIDELA